MFLLLYFLGLGKALVQLLAELYMSPEKDELIINPLMINDLEALALSPRLKIGVTWQLEGTPAGVLKGERSNASRSKT